MPIALVVLAVGGMIVNQTAFQADRLAWTLPALTVAQPMVGFVLAAVIFSERLDVTATATNGYGTVPGYDAADNAAFALATPCPDCDGQEDA